MALQLANNQGTLSARTLAKKQKNKKLIHCYSTTMEFCSVVFLFCLSTKLLLHLKEASSTCSSSRFFLTTTTHQLCVNLKIYTVARVFFKRIRSMDWPTQANLSDPAEWPRLCKHQLSSHNTTWLLRWRLKYSAKTSQAWTHPSVLRKTQIWAAECLFFSHSCPVLRLLPPGLHLCSSWHIRTFSVWPLLLVSSPQTPRWIQRPSALSAASVLTLVFLQFHSFPVDTILFITSNSTQLLFHFSLITRKLYTCDVQ